MRTIEYKATVVVPLPCCCVVPTTIVQCNETPVQRAVSSTFHVSSSYCVQWHSQNLVTGEAHSVAGRVGTGQDLFCKFWLVGSKIIEVRDIYFLSAGIPVFIRLVNDPINSPC